MDANAAHIDAGSRPDQLRLTSLVAASLSALFVALLAVFTGQIQVVWPLFLVPIIIASIAHGVPGAVLATTLCAGILALILPNAELEVTPRIGMIVGFLSFLAAGMAVAVYAARSRNQVRSLERASVHDPDTGLLKPSPLRERLLVEVARSSRHGVDVSIVVIHIDDLCGFRSTFGGYKAGLLLEHMADVVRIAVRETDVVGRWGPDSFAVVAPFAGPTEADLIAERIQRAVREARFEGDVLEPATACSVTVVYASTPREATGFDALVDLAEQRLSTAIVEPSAGIDGAPSPEATARAGA